MTSKYLLLGSAALLGSLFLAGNAQALPYADASNQITNLTINGITIPGGVQSRITPTAFSETIQATASFSGSVGFDRHSGGDHHSEPAEPRHSAGVFRHRRACIELPSPLLGQAALLAPGRIRISVRPTRRPAPSASTTSPRAQATSRVSGPPMPTIRRRWASPSPAPGRASFSSSLIPIR